MAPRFYVPAVALVLSVFISGSSRGDDVFTLFLEHYGAGFLMGKAGENVTFECRTYLEHSGTGPGARAWSLGVAVEGAAVTSAKTTAEYYGDPAGSLERIHITDPAENGGMSGVVSHVILSTQGLETAVLPARSRAEVLSLDLAGTVPQGVSTLAFECRGGLEVGGEAFPLSVTQGVMEIVPVTLPPLEIPLFDSNDCCSYPVNLGFSAAVIKDGPVFEGIAGVGEKCLAAGGEIIAEAPLGARNSTTVHVNIISSLTDSDDHTVQGWTLGVAVDGSAEIRSITRAGTSADTVANGGYLGAALGRIDIIDPAKNGGQKGVLDSAVLDLVGTPGAVMPPVGTQTILKIVLAAAELQGDADQTATLRFQDGLVGIGRKAPLELLVAGSSVIPCNADRAGVTVVFRKGPDAPFRRGDSNNDGKVDIGDALATLNWLFKGWAQPRCRNAADANDSGLIDISDPVHVLNFLFAGESPPPPAPGPEACGSDPTDDSLDCIESICP